MLLRLALFVTGYRRKQFLTCTVRPGMKAFVWLILLIWLPMLTYAQASHTGNWWIYFGNQKLSHRWSWHNEVQYRNYNAAGDLEQLLLRTGIGYNLSENNNTALLGYAYIHSEPYLTGSNEKQTILEHRLYQQFVTRQQYGRVYIQHRYRLEQRFMEEAFRVRYRYFLALNIPVNKKELVKNALYVSAYNEIFIHHQPSFLDRNRVYGAAGYVIHPYLRVEVGYMSQLLANRSRSQFQIVLFNHLPLKKANPTSSS